MEKEMQEIEIAGTKFLLDIDKVALIEKDNPYNVIYFHYMDDHGTHYSFDYSPNTKNQSFFTAEDGFFVPEDYGKEPPFKVEIPRIGKIDPDGMCQKYGCSLQDIEVKSDFEIMVNQEVLNKRLNGEPVTIDLAGKIYEVDVKHNALHPQDDTGEVIYLSKHHFDAYYNDEPYYHLFFYFSDNTVVDAMSVLTANMNDNCVILEIPDLYNLDPIGGNIEKGVNLKSNLIFYKPTLHHVAKQVPLDFYNIQIADEKKTLQPQQDQNQSNTISENPYDLRVNKGMLPTVDIAGHTFYVDIRMDMLRPKDDFLSKGIVFSNIQNYYDEDKRTYTIPYNPKTHEFQEPDYRNIKELPKDLIAVEFPSERLLDRIGWNRNYGFDLNHGIDKSNFKLQFTAKNVPWKETFLVGLIERNLKSEKKQNETNEKQQPNNPKPMKQKGRKM